MNDNPMSLMFQKIQAQGNSYIFLDYLDEPLPDVDWEELARTISDKSFGIGSDGLVVLLPDNEADAYIRIWNADGSEACNCGSALRSTVSILHEKDKEKKSKYTMRIASGIVSGHIDNNSSGFDIGISFHDIRTFRIDGADAEKSRNDMIEINKMIGLPVCVGNPHFVIFDELQRDSFDLKDSLFIHHTGNMLNNSYAYFPDGVNVEFVSIVSPHEINVRVWERGSGETLACGTGACAAVYAGVHLGRLDNEVKVNYPGGTLNVIMDYPHHKCRLSGQVTLVSKGSFFYRKVQK